MLLWSEHIKVKVKLFLCTSYKAYGSGGWAPLSLNLGTRRSSIVSLRPRLVYAPTHKEEPLVYTEEKAGWVPLLVWMLWRRKQNLLLSLRIKPRFLGCSSQSLATVLTMQFQLTWPDRKGQKRNATSTALSTMSNWPQGPSQMTTNSSWISINREDMGATASGGSFVFLINLRRLNHTENLTPAAY